MKCPYCSNEINIPKECERKMQEILEILNEKEYSIAQLSRKLNINRTTLRYYLNKLTMERKIEQVRTKFICGRPTLLKIIKK